MVIDVKKALLKVSKLLKKADIKRFQQDSVLILSDVLGKSIEYIYAHSEDEISSEDLEKSLEMVEKRANGMPIAYILGKKEFFGLEFKVNSSTLIPRPETEMMVDEAINWVKIFSKNEELLILDMGTGSGCVPVAIAKNVGENVEFIATDFSEDALEVASENIEFHGLLNKLELKKGDLLKDVNISIFDRKNVLITANLPYLSREIYEDSPSSVQDFEPKEALISGVDGLDHYQMLFDEIKDKKILDIAESVKLLLEISPEQKELIEELIKEKFGDKVQVSSEKDLAGKWRLVKIELIPVALIQKDLNDQNRYEDDEKIFTKVS